MYPSGISTTGVCCKEQMPVLLVCREMPTAGVCVQRVWVQELGRGSSPLTSLPGPHLSDTGCMNG